MRTTRNAADLSGDALETRCDALLLARLGRELASLYRDSLDAPLPPTLRHLMERLAAAVNARGGDAVTVRDDR